MERDDQCQVCDGLLGDLDPGQTFHKFCGWASAADWVALKPYLNGSFLGVHAGGC